MQKTILYAVLNWGLGHATRSIPIIKHLMELGHRLVVASDGLALELLVKEFPNIEVIETEPYAVHYSSNAKMFNLDLAMQIPKFINAINKEHKHCQEICKSHQVDYIISDNRYGFYAIDIPSAFICHQLKLLYPDSKIVENIVNKSYKNYLKKFSQLWVPDLSPPNNISKEMSNLSWDNVKYIGIDSRLSLKSVKSKFAVLAILSGPEPQRSLLEKEILNKLKEKEGSHCLIRGTRLAFNEKSKANVKILDLVDSLEMNQLINESELIVCRAGYTSIMDLIALKKQAILIPTPGQAEQEYLAKNLSKQDWFNCQSQGNIDLDNLGNHQSPEIEITYNFKIIQDFLSY